MNSVCVGCLVGGWVGEYMVGIYPNARLSQCRFRLRNRHDGADGAPRHGADSAVVRCMKERKT